MSWGKKIKKAVGKVVNKVTGGNTMLNKVIGVGLAPVTGGASMSPADKASRMQVASEEKEQAAEQARADQEAADNANKEFIASVNRQRETSLLGKSKTDYTGDLTDDYEDSEETTNKLLSRPLVTKRRKLLGM